jgi:hypothetical protein
MHLSPRGYTSGLLPRGYAYALGDLTLVLEPLSLVFHVRC